MASVGQLLKEVNLDDSQVKLQGATGSIEYQLNDEGDEVGYRDAAAYDSITKRAGMPPLDLSRVGELERMIQQGEQYVSFLYTYRSLFQPLGRAKPKSDDVKPQFYHTICKTMHPAIMSLFNLVEYVTNAIDRVKEVTMALTMSNDTAPRELMMEKLLCLLDVLVVIDTTRATKACLQNDFSFYKRQTQALMTKDISEALKAAGTDPNEFSIDPDKQMKLAEFLQSSFFECVFVFHPTFHPIFQLTFHPNLWLIFGEIRRRPRAAHGMVPSLVGTIKDMKEFHVPVTQLLRYAQKRYEDRYYVLPKEKWRLLRTMAVCLVVLGWTVENSLWGAKEAKAHMAKEVKLDKILGHIREYPIIPMFGDMQLAPAVLLVRFFTVFSSFFIVFHCCFH